ncbi:hypothetical protein DV20_41635 [Amycolatopsis rifamycinica]|uniref:Uncharacterized protein n=1 Tax=Amycolatopsis rifamycinica TaxID=287986 RepID=A0A066TNC6_9PSEU|nr:hypothetical protein DV20_41635 [Amycolatopsis rifamycinica]
MGARVAEDLAEQFGRAVDDRRLTGEALRGSHEADNLDDPRDVVNAHQGVHGRERVERRRPRVALRLFGADLRADLAGRGEHAVDEGQLAGGVDVLAALHGGHVRGQRGRDAGQLDAELLEPFAPAHPGQPFGRFR